MAGRPTPPLQLPKRLRVAIEKRAKSQKEPHLVVVRARVILLAVAGMATAAIARRLGVCESMVRKWRTRMEKCPQVASLYDLPRSGRPREIPVEARCDLVKIACQRPADRPKAPLEPRLDAARASAGTARRDRAVAQLERDHEDASVERDTPHRVRQWLHSPDPEFRPKVKRICDLYLSPPPGAAVVCVDEKSGMQALERIHPAHTVGGVVRQEFEYRRGGTSTLIAAFDVVTGRVFGQLRRRTAKGLVAFMEALAKRYPSGPVYVIWDNLNIHYDGRDKRWTRFNARHGHRFHFVYTPKHASWVNQIEIWFSILARKALKHSSFASKRELEDAVRRFIREWNRQAHPFRWKFRGDFENRQLRFAA